MQFFITILLLALIWGCGFLGYIQGYTEANTEALEECQKDLPRSEYCVMIAVPEKDLDDKGGSDE